MVMTVACLVLAAIAARGRWRIIERIALSLTMIGLGAALWTVRNSTTTGRDLGRLADEAGLASERAVRLTGIVANIPALDTIVHSNAKTPSRPRQSRTLFLLKAESLNLTDIAVPIRGACRVLVDGDATTLLKWGDRVELTGQIDLAPPPSNPGEFDFRRHLRRRGISVMMFVRHSAAVRVLHSNAWHPKALLTAFRQRTVALLKSQLSPGNRAAAEAMLLGNRGHLTSDLERDFIASGTMHLLAISGLHVGILYVFLVRVLNMLLVPRTRALLLAGMVCVMYCFLTDLRPSVMRATLFILLYILGQVTCRDLKMGSLIGVTAILLIVADPAIVFDVGAWLSFLAVGALGWVSDRTPPPEDRAVPIEALTWRDRLQEISLEIVGWLRLRYRQMLAVTMLSAPLAATQFHVVSLTGIVINILLIPFTAFTLIVGYVFIAIGLALPPFAGVSGVCLNTLLSAMNGVVTFSGDVRFGFITIPDVSTWFLAAYYGLLAASAIASRSVVRQSFRLSLLTLVVVSLFVVSRTPVSPDLVCTVLSVGHGNAVVVETPEGKILLFDAGALNRGERTADLISHFLWKKGYRMIDAIVISHADMDHFNAVASLLDRIRVGQVMITQEFARSNASEAQYVLEVISRLDVQCHLVLDGDKFRVNNLTVDFLQADLKDSTAESDNASSVVAVLTFRDRRICLPGDLEGTGQQQLISRLPSCDLLLSPHHGSLPANTRELAEKLQPEHVVVSSRTDKLQDALRSVYADSQVFLTSDVGAVSYRVSATGETTISSFRESALTPQ